MPLNDLTLGLSLFPQALEVRNLLHNSARQGVSSRYRRLDRLEAWYRCLEYSHHRYDWSGYEADLIETISVNSAMPEGFTQINKVDVANLRQKRPTAPKRLCPSVVNRFTGLLFSKERTPELTVEGDEQSEDFLREVFRRSRFWATMYQARTYGGSQGSALVTVELLNGVFVYKSHNPKTVQDILYEDASGRSIAGVLIQYPTVEEFEVLDKNGKPTGKFIEKQMLVRRIIDAEWDVRFKPAPIDGDELPDLEIDERMSVRHALGRFPGTWIQNLPVDEALDGQPDCEGAFQLFDTIDRLIAQANRGLLANMDPTVVVSLDPKIAAQTGGQIQKGSENAINVGTGGSAAYLEINAAGITAGRELAKELKQDALDLCQCVLVDPEKIAGSAQSAKAIEFIYAPMLEKAGRLRDQYGPAAEELADITLLMARQWMSKDSYVGNKKAKFALPPRIIERDADPSNPDAPPAKSYVDREPGKEGGIITLRWGPYFHPTPADVQMKTGTVSATFAARLLDKETAVRLIAPSFDIKDQDGLIRKIREEQEEEEQKALEGPYGDGQLSAMDGADKYDPQAAVDKATKQLSPYTDKTPVPQDAEASAIANASDTALNGAQVVAAKELLLDVASGKLPRETGINALIQFFNLHPDAAEALMGPIGDTFKITPETAAAQPGKPPPKAPFGGGPPGAPGAPPNGFQKAADKSAPDNKES